MVLNANNHYVLDDFKFRFLRGNIVFFAKSFYYLFKKIYIPNIFLQKITPCY